MPEDPEADRQALTNFPLLWRWTRDTHASLPPDEIESIRSLPEHQAAILCDKCDPIINERSSTGARRRLLVDDESDHAAVAKWLDDVIPADRDELVLIWDRRTTARVPRALFVRRWDDFWYPASDDLSVIGTEGTWHLEMHHYGSFEFSSQVG